MRCNKLLPVLMLSTLFVLPITGAIAADSAAAAPTFGDYQAKGFLSDYSKIPTTPAEDGAYQYLDPNFDAKKYNWTEGVTAGVGSYLKSYTKWDYTKEAMDHWAQMIRARLDQVHGKETEK